MTNQLITRLYKDILEQGLIPHQYFYQRLKGKLTGNYEFMLREPEGFPNYIGPNHDLLCVLNGGYVAPDGISCCTIRFIYPRRFVYKNTAEWCIRYVWESAKNIAKNAL